MPTPGQPETYSREANERLSAWLDTMKESPAKFAAALVADAWDKQGVDAAQKLFREQTALMKRWEASAVADMVAAFRARACLERSQ